MPAYKQIFNWSKFLKFHSTNKKDDRRSGPGQREVSVINQSFIPDPNRSGFGKAEFVKNQFGLNAATGISMMTENPQKQSVSDILICPAPSPYFTGRKETLAQLSAIFLPPVVALYSPKEEDLAEFIRDYLKWSRCTPIILDGRSVTALVKAVAEKIQNSRLSVPDTVVIVENMDSALDIWEHLPKWLYLPVLITSTDKDIVSKEIAASVFQLDSLADQVKVNEIKCSIQKVLHLKQHVVSLVAMGGTGKTQVALKFVAENFERFTNIWFFDASSKATLEENFASLGRAANIGDNVESIKTFLATRTLMANWLCIFNNADDNTILLENYIPSCQHGSILVTSHLKGRSQLASSPECSITLRHLCRGSAVQLLLAYVHETNSEENMNQAGKIVDALGCHSHAVASAGLYMKSMLNATLEDYSELSKFKKIDILKYKTLDSKSVFDTFIASCNQLSQSARSLLQVCSGLHPKNIPVELFSRAWSENFGKNSCYDIDSEFAGKKEMIGFAALFSTEEILDQCIDELQQLCLVSDDVEKRYLTYHPVVHNCALESLSYYSVQNLKFVTALLLAVAIPTGDSERDYAFRRQLLLHVNYIPLENFVTIEAKKRVARVFWESDYWEKAEILQEEILLIHEKTLGKEHPDTLTAMNNLASTYYAYGKLERAQKLQIEVLQQQRNLFGNNHSNTLTSMNNLALTYSACNEIEKAEKLNEEVHELRIKLLGKNHPDTLTSMNNLASTYFSHGQLRKAEELQEEAFKLQQEVLGKYHPDTLTSLNNLASIYAENGRLTEAQKLQEELVIHQKAILGQHHPNTLISMNNLASTYFAYKKFEQAEQLQEEVLLLQKKILINTHPDILKSINNLASTYFSLQKFEEAEVLLEEMVLLQKHVLGEQHANTLSTMSHLALTYFALRKLEKAEELQEIVLMMQQNLFGEYHLDTMTSMNNLVASYYAHSKWEQAEKLQVQLLRLQKQVYGNQHFTTLTSTKKLAFIYYAYGNLDEAQKVLEEALSLWKEISESVHDSEFVVSVNNTASIDQTQSFLDEVLSLQKQILASKSISFF